MGKKLGPREAGKADVALGKKIRVLRDAANVTQSALAEHLGVTFQQIQKYEKGINRVTAARLHRLAAFFNIDLAHFYEAPNDAEPVKSLIFAQDPQSLRLIRAYSRIKKVETQHRIVLLAETLAESCE